MRPGCFHSRWLVTGTRVSALVLGELETERGRDLRPRSERERLRAETRKTEGMDML